MMNSVSSNKSKSLLFVISVLLIYPLPQFAIDLYTPSWVAMMAHFHATHAQIQFSLIIYILCLGLTQLIYGPISDVFGRKPVLLFGVIVFMVASLLCANAQTVTQLYIYRAIQGLGLGCGFTLASAILGDVYHGNRLAQMTSYSAMVYSSALILAPWLGGEIQHYFNWRYCFWFLFVNAALLVVMIAFFIQETAPKQEQNTAVVAESLKHYWTCMTNVAFLSNTLALTLAYSFIVALSVIAPFLLIKQMHMSSVVYGRFLALVGLCYFLGATANSRIIKKHSMDLSTTVGLACMFLSSALLVLISLLHMLATSAIVVSVCIAIFGVGFVYPNCFARALDVFKGKGASGAFIGSAGLIGTGVVSMVVSGVSMPLLSLLACCFAVLSVLCVFCIVIAKKMLGKMPSELATD